MKTLAKTVINYKNDRVELSEFGKGTMRFYISNGCTPLGFADTLEEAYNIYNKKVKALKARRTRDFNKKVAFVKSEIDRVDFDCVIKVFTRDFHITEEQVREIFAK